MMTSGVLSDLRLGLDDLSFLENVKLPPDSALALNDFGVLEYVMLLLRSAFDIGGKLCGHVDEV